MLTIFAASIVAASALAVLAVALWWQARQARQVRRHRATTQHDQPYTVFVGLNLREAGEAMRDHAERHPGARRLAMSVETAARDGVCGRRVAEFHVHERAFDHPLIDQAVAQLERAKAKTRSVASGTEGVPS